MNDLRAWSRLVCPMLFATVQGCASPEPPVVQTIRLQTPGCAAASCELSNDRGHWVLARTHAAASGLRSGDVILSVNGQDVLDAADLEERVLALPVEQPLTLRVWRARQILDFVLTPAPKGAR